MIKMIFKIDSPVISRKVQKKLFSMGYRWVTNGKEICHEDKPYIYVYDDYTLKFGTLCSSKNEKKYLVSVFSILEIVPDELFKI